MLLLGLVCSSQASASEWVMMGWRYQGMGGAGVATVNDSLASYWNPAALAQGQAWDASLNIDMSASVEGDALEVFSREVEFLHLTSQRHSVDPAGADGPQGATGGI